MEDEFASIREHYEAGLELTDEEMDTVADVAVDFLKNIHDGDDGELILDVNGGDLAVLIGRHGKTLDALQMVLSSLVSNKLKFHYPVSVDIEGYKTRRKNKIQQMARQAADRARKQGGRVTLAPMNAFERRLVHLALVSYDDVTTHSAGEEPNRRVVILSCLKGSVFAHTPLSVSQ